jgi:hypothetical protein
VCVEIFSGLDAIVSRLVRKMANKTGPTKKGMDSVGNHFRCFKDGEDQCGFPYKFYNLQF